MSDAWRQQFALPLVAALHRAYFQNGTVVNSEEIGIIAGRLSTFESHDKGRGLSFVFRAERGQIRIDLPVFQVGSSGPQVNGETALFIAGEVREREINVVAIQFRDAITGHNRR